MQENAHTAANEFANINGRETSQSGEMELNGSTVNSPQGVEDAEDDDNNDDEEDEDDEEDDQGDGAFGEISEREEEDDEDDEEEDAGEGEEDQDSGSKDTSESQDRNGQTSARLSVINGNASSEHLHRKRRDSHDVAFDAELDPDLYGLRRSVSSRKVLSKAASFQATFRLISLAWPL